MTVDMKKLETLFDNQLTNINKLFNKHNLDGKKVFNHIYKNKAKIISSANNVFDIPNTICIMIKENSKDIVVKLTQKEKELVKLAISIVVDKYQKENPDVPKEDIEYTIYGKLLSTMPNLLRNKVVVLDVGEMLYDIRGLNTKILNDFIQEKITSSNMKFNSHKGFDKDSILEFKITSPRMSIIQNKKNVNTLANAIIKAPTELDITRYERFESKIQETINNKDVPAIMRNFLKNNTKINPSKGLILRDGNDILIIGTEYICNATEVLAIKKSDEKYSDFINGFFKNRKVNYDRNFLRYTLNTIIIAYDMRTSIKQG